MVMKSVAVRRAGTCVVALGLFLLFNNACRGNTPSFTQGGSVTAAAGAFYVPRYQANFNFENVEANANVNYATSGVPTLFTPGTTSGTAAPDLFTFQQRLDDGTDDGLLVSFSAEAIAFAQTSISTNTLHALARVAGSVSPISYVYFTDDGATTNIATNPAGSKAIARASAEIVDYVTITSDTLPRGAPVQVTISGTLHSSVTDPEADVIGLPGLTSARAQFVADDAFGGDVNFTLVDGDGLTLPHLTKSQVAGILDAHVGDTFQVTSSINVSAVGVASSAFGPFGIFDFINEASAGDTAFMNIDAITSGISLSAASGIVYATPAPEPAALSLVAAGSLILISRRCKSSRVA